MIFLSAILTMLCCLPCFAEDLQKRRTCRIVFADLPVGIPDEVYLFDGQSSHMIRPSNMKFSEAVFLPLGDLILHVTKLSVTESEEVPSGSPGIRIAAAVNDFYLVAVVDTDNKALPIRILSVDDEKELPSKGETLWINLTDHTLRGEFGNSRISIPAEARLLCTSPVPDSGYFKATFQYKPNGKGEFLPLINKSWWFDSTSRSLGIIIDTGSRLPRIYTLTDRSDADSVSEGN